jgi:aspartate-semialdehyde dehydrogenase
MNSISVAVFANDPLLLSELLGRLEEEFPLLNINIYSSEDFLPAIAAEKPSYEVKSISSLQDEEIAVVLSDPGQYADAIRKLGASVIDCTGIFRDTYDDVYLVEEPVEYLISHFKGDRQSIRGSLYLPAALFGKNGIDDLLSQTRNLFSFGRDKSKVFEERIAFNVLLGGDEEGNILSGYKKRLEESAGMPLNFRIIPVSTVFLADFFIGDNVSLDENRMFYEYKAAGLEEAMENNGIGVMRNTSGGMISFTGDYIKVLTGQIALHLKEITGE